MFIAPFFQGEFLLSKKDPECFLSINYIRAGKNDEFREINRIKS